MKIKKWAKLQKSLLKSQQKIIRLFLKEEKEPKFKPRVGGCGWIVKKFNRNRFQINFKK